MGAGPVRPGGVDRNGQVRTGRPGMTSDAETGDVIAILHITGHRDHQMRSPVAIGRDPRAGERAAVEVGGDPLVSKSHRCIDIDQRDVIITDLGSSNGTYLKHTQGETAVPGDRWIPVPRAPRSNSAINR
jgi:pSer/pThr/pTyr-binding forkhead associated (FHA) protein